MEVQDHNLMVANLDTIISTGGNIAKTSSCIYTAAVSNGSYGHETSVVELTSPVQCLGAAIPRLQHQHVAQLQTIQYPQTISYEPAQPIHQHTNLVPGHAIYQPMSTAPLHHYSSSQAILNNTAFLSTSSAPAQTIHLAPVLPNSTPSNIAHHSPVQANDGFRTSEQHAVQKSSEEVEEPEDLDEGPPEPTFPEDDYEYYRELLDYLGAIKFPTGVSENYRKHLIKRSQHYMVIDGKLFHNRKQPKEVIMKKEEQQAMIKDIHIVRETGVHLGVKKMFHKLQLKHFWRGMYIDIVTFVKNCEKCSDLADMARQKEQDEENFSAIEQCTIATQCTGKVWKKVEVWIHGPLDKTCSHQEFLVTVVDEESRWITATPVSSSESVSEVADFLFHTFCSYGFPSCHLVGFSTEIKDHLTVELKSKTKNLANLKLSVGDETSANCKWVKNVVSLLVEMHPEWDKNLNHFLFQYRIGQLKDSFGSTNFSSPFSAIFNHNPLNIDYNNDDNKENIDNDDENLNSSYSKKKKALNNTLQCAQCNAVYSSKISLLIHQRKHSDSASDVDESKSRSHLKRKKNIIRKGVLSISSTSSVIKKSVVGEKDFKPPETCVESTVSAVKALLAATKEERRRRGKYHKYSPELQEHMATYAIKHGTQQAVKYFSERLGTVVPGSTVRNIVKVYSSFAPILKEEIGRFAANFGVESASRYFSERLKRDIPQSLVRKFKVIHLKRLPDGNKKPKDKIQDRDVKKRCIIKKVIDSNLGKAKRYNNRVKEEIGFHACQHSLSDTAKYFSEKLQTVVKERTVKRFHKAYVERYHQQIDISGNNQISVSEHIPPDSILPVNLQPQPLHHFTTPFSQQLSASVSTACLPPPPPPPCLPHPPRIHPPLPLYPLNQCSSSSDCFQAPTSSVIMTQTSGSFQYQSITPVQNYQTTQPFSSQHSGSQSLSHQPHQGQSSFVITQQPLIVSSEPSSINVSTQFMVAPPPSNQQVETFRPSLEKGSQKSSSDESDVQLYIAVKCDDNEIEQSSFNSERGVPSRTDSVTNSTIDVSDIMPTVSDPLKQSIEPSVNCSEKETILDGSEETQKIKKPNERKRQKWKSKKKETSKKRGTYTFYSPELRAEIGKYAAEHSSIKASQHFSKLLGHDVPESTARGLKDKYLQKKNHCTVTSLGYSQRGRPLRLGKYDEVVQECLKELVRHGERVTSYLAITTAKLILNKYEPSLLEENGGSIKLNITWAKSFLKRIGVHNNS